MHGGGLTAFMDTLHFPQTKSEFLKAIANAIPDYARVDRWNICHGQVTDLYVGSLGPWEISRPDGFRTLLISLFIPPATVRTADLLARLVADNVADPSVFTNYGLIEEYLQAKARESKV